MVYRSRRKILRLKFVMAFVALGVLADFYLNCSQTKNRRLPFVMAFVALEVLADLSLPVTSAARHYK